MIALRPSISPALAILVMNVFPRAFDPNIMPRPESRMCRPSGLSPSLNRMLPGLYTRDVRLHVTNVRSAEVSKIRGMDRVTRSIRNQHNQRVHFIATDPLLER